MIETADDAFTISEQALPMNEQASLNWGVWWIWRKGAYEVHFG
jgi:hypothetical protein